MLAAMPKVKRSTWRLSASTYARRRAAVTVAALLAFTVCVTPASALRPQSTPSADWDANIAPLARAAEDLRDLKFRHAVPVEFLDDAAFRERITGDRTSTDSEEIGRSQAELRALGLVAAGFDLERSASAFESTSALAYYSPKSQRIIVRGQPAAGGLDVAHRVTLVHELTHALQDQHFDLEALRRRSRRANTEAAFVAVVEGDASRIEGDYVATLSSPARAAYEQTQGAELGDAQRLLREQQVPELVVALAEAPYALGTPLMATLVASHVRDGPNAPFLDPPKNDLALVDPSLGLSAGSRARVPAPRLRAGEQMAGREDVLGAVGLFFVLASRLNVEQAFNAARQWGGDRLLAFRRADSSCIRDNIVGRTAADTRAIQRALATWGDSLDTGTHDVSSNARVVSLESCQPDVGGSAGPKNSPLRALTFVATRSELLAQIERIGLPASTAKCAADRLVRNPVFQPILDTPLGATPSAAALRALQALTIKVTRACARR